MHAWFPNEPDIDAIWTKLNTMPGLRLTREQVLSAGAAMGLRRPPRIEPQPKQSHKSSTEATWLEIANWCHDQGIRFNGDMTPVNLARNKLNLPMWVCVEPFGPGSTASTLAENANGKGAQ